VKEHLYYCFHCNIIALLMATAVQLRKKEERKKGKKRNPVN